MHLQAAMGWLLTFLHSLVCVCFCTGRRGAPEASQDEYGEEDHGPAPAGGVQPPGQCAGADAPAAPLHRALPPSPAYDPERTGGKTVHDAAGI